MPIRLDGSLTLTGPGITLTGITATIKQIDGQDMRVTTKGQVTIPQDIRYKLGVGPGTEVEFIEENGRIYVTKAPERPGRPAGRFAGQRGAATVRMTTDEILALTRADDE